MEAWHVFHTKPHCEFLVNRVLDAHGLTTYLPLLATRDAERGEPLFPSYIFVLCDDPTAVSLASVPWVPGLEVVVTFDGQPAIVPDLTVANLKAGLYKGATRGGPSETPAVYDGATMAVEEPITFLSHAAGTTRSNETPTHCLDQVSQTAPPNANRSAGPSSDARLHRRRTRGKGRRIHYPDV